MWWLPAVARMPDFVHIAKTGGDSVRHMYNAANIAYYPDTIWAKRWMVHNKTMSITGCHNPSHYANVPKPTWCIIRDPVDRAISSYNMRNKARGTCDRNHLEEWLIHNFINEYEVDGHFFAATDPMPYCDPVLFGGPRPGRSSAKRHKAHRVGAKHTCTRGDLFADNGRLNAKYTGDIRLREGLRALARKPC